MTIQSNYLTAADCALFGVPSATDVQIAQACTVVDAYLQRVEGLLWTPDSTGKPMCMTRKPAESARTLVGSITPGSLVPVQLTPGPIVQQGASIVLNRAGNTAEVCKISSITSENNYILKTVQNLHSAVETAETGLTIEETITLPKSRTLATLSKGPIVRVVSAFGRVTYTRRSRDTQQQSMQDYGMLAAVSAFGGAPVWQEIQLADSDIDTSTNQVWCPTGIMMVPYNEVRFSYISGFQASALPYQIKQATANILKAIGESPAGASIKTFKAGETQMERFLASIIDDETRLMLGPFVAKNYG